VFFSLNLTQLPAHIEMDSLNIILFECHCTLQGARSYGVSLSRKWSK